MHYLNLKYIANVAADNPNHVIRIFQMVIFKSNLFIFCNWIKSSSDGFYEGRNYKTKTKQDQTKIYKNN